MEQEEKELAKKAAEESRLNKDITVKFLITFTVPTILSFVVMGVFGMIDGIFAARGIGVEALSAVNIVIPFFTFSMAVGAMLAMGGCALVAKKKGKNLKQEARQNFTLLALVTFGISAFICVIGWFLRKPLLRMLGADDFIFDLALTYIQPLILMAPFLLLGVFLTQFLIAEGRPIIGMLASISGAIVSTSLNALFIFVFDMGLFGLALASGIGYAVPTVLGLVYFTLNRRGTIFFVRPKWDIKALGRSSLNGISEMITMMSMTVTIVVMNNVLIRIVGFQGVAAAGIVMALQGIFASLYFGYSAGIAPVISYNHGKQKHDRLKTIFKRSMYIIAVLAVIAMVMTLAFADLLVRIYVPAGTEMHTMTVRGLRIVTMGFLLMGYNVFATAMFTAFNDGVVSGFMSLMRTLVFTLTLLILLPMAWGLTGAWIALPLAEALSVIVTIIFFIIMAKKYKYLQTRSTNI